MPPLHYVLRTAQCLLTREALVSSISGFLSRIGPAIVKAAAPAALTPTLSFKALHALRIENCSYFQCHLNTVILYLTNPWVRC